MTEYATPTNTTNPVLNPLTYWRVSAFALTATALLGVVMEIANDGKFISNFMNFDWTHDVVHMVLAGAAFIFGFAALPGKVVKTFAIIFGVVYAGLGILGFVVGEEALVGTGQLTLELGENLVHLLLGTWGLVTGIAAKYD